MTRDVDAMNADELRALLADCIAQLREGTMTPSQANATSRAVRKMLAQREAALRVRRLGVKSQLIDRS
jgi:hypothetical protein